MKTPDEIKKGLMCCWEDGCATCPYDDDCGTTDHFTDLASEALHYICRLESEVKHYTSPFYRRPAEIELSQIVTKKKARVTELESRLSQVERERDSMMPVFIREMKKYGCSTCEHYIPAAYTQECLGCGNAKLLHWKWNGVCPENTKEETH